VQRIETKQDTYEAVRESLSSCSKASSVDKVEAPCLAACFGGGGRSQSEERVVEVGRVALCRAKGRLAILYRTNNTICLMRPVTLQLNHLKVQVRQVDAEAGRTFDGDRLSPIVRELEATCNSVVFGEY
jgi:hypothetical protein